MSIIDTELTALPKGSWEQSAVFSMAVPVLCVWIIIEEKVVFPAEDESWNKRAFPHWEVKQG